MPGADTVAVQLPEDPVGGKLLWRHVKHDPRSSEFEIDRAQQTVRVTHQVTRLPLNQGHIGSCTANALCAVRH